MGSVDVDYSDLFRHMQSLFSEIANVDISIRPVAVELVGIMHKRIHTDGLDSSGNLIGHYSESYLARRKRAGLGTGTNIIAVYTRKLSNSWTVFPTDRGYAVGFTDQNADGVSSLQKLKFIEEMKSKKILDLTADESQYANERLIEIAAEIISNQSK